MEAEARIIKLAMSALEAAGLSKLKVTLGDLGLFNALLDDMPMPERWRRTPVTSSGVRKPSAACSGNFAKPSTAKRTAISEHVDAIAGKDADAATSARMAELNLPHVTDRSIADIAARLSEKLADRFEAPLAADMVKRIEPIWHWKVH